MTLDYKEIGQNIKFYRTKKKLKQAKLAELVDVSEQHISHIECGRTKLSLPVLVGLAEVLEVDIYAILGDNSRKALDHEFAEVLKDATPAQRKQCLELCRTAIKYSVIEKKEGTDT